MSEKRIVTNGPVNQESFDKILSSGVPKSIVPLYRKEEPSLKGYFMEKLVSRCGELQGSGILLHGIPGCGKTHLLTWAYIKILLSGVHGVWMMETELIGRVIRGEKYQSDYEETPWFDKLVEVPLLFIDDVQGHKVTSDVLSKRDLYGGLTLITTQKSPENWTERERGILLGVCLPMEMDSDNLRGNRQEKMKDVLTK